MLDPWLLAVAVVLIGVVAYRSFNRVRAVDHDGTSLGVDQLLEKLRTELEQFDQKRGDSNRAPLLRLQGVEVDISFVVKRSDTSSAGAKFEVLTVGQAETTAREEVQRLKLTWLPTPDRSGSAPIQIESQTPPPTHTPKK